MLLAWAAINTSISMARYGIEQGVYWWFCNLAMIGVGLGLWFRHEGWLLGFLSIASFTQTFWIIDNIYRITTGENLFGLVEFMYQPGNPMDEFLLSHYHFFILPTGVLGLVLLKERKRLSHWWLAATNAFIFGMSYFAFPASQNLNCIHEPCLPALEKYRGPVYSLLFFAAVCAGCLLLSEVARRKLAKIKLRKADRELAFTAYGIVCALALVMTAIDVRHKLSLPRFACADGPVTGEVDVRCRFTLEHAPRVLALTYHIRNLASEPRECRTFLEHDGKKEPMDERVRVEGRGEKDVRTLLAYPDGNVTARLTAECR